MFRDQSNNRRSRGMCEEVHEGTNIPKYWSIYNNEEECTNNSRKLIAILFSVQLILYCSADRWVQLYAYLDIDQTVTTESRCTGSDRVWAQPWLHEPPRCLELPPVPECFAAGWTRVNHLGNGRDGVPLNYTWRLPYFPSGRSQRCVLRIR